MKNKGLCDTCINDKKCVFRTKFPVLHCEEFSDYQLTTDKTKGNTLKSSKRREVRCGNLETAESFE